MVCADLYTLDIIIQWIQESVIPGLHALIFRDTAHAPLALPVPPVPLMSAAHSASGGDSDIEHEVLAIGRSRPGCAGQENEFLELWGDKTCTWEPYKNVKDCKKMEDLASSLRRRRQLPRNRRISASDVTARHATIARAPVPLHTSRSLAQPQEQAQQPRACRTAAATTHVAGHPLGSPNCGQLPRCGAAAVAHSAVM